MTSRIGNQKITGYRRPTSAAQHASLLQRCRRHRPRHGGPDHGLRLATLDTLQDREQQRQKLSKHRRKRRPHQRGRTGENQLVSRSLWQKSAPQIGGTVPKIGDRSITVSRSLRNRRARQRQADLKERGPCHCCPKHRAAQKRQWRIAAEGRRASR